MLGCQTTAYHYVRGRGRHRAVLLSVLLASTGCTSVGPTGKWESPGGRLSRRSLGSDQRGRLPQHCDDRDQYPRPRSPDKPVIVHRLGPAGSALLWRPATMESLSPAMFTTAGLPAEAARGAHHRRGRRVVAVPETVGAGATDSFARLGCLCRRAASVVQGSRLATTQPPGDNRVLARADAGTDKLRAVLPALRVIGEQVSAVQASPPPGPGNDCGLMRRSRAGAVRRL